MSILIDKYIFFAVKNYKGYPISLSFTPEAGFNETTIHFTLLFTGLVLLCTKETSF